VRPLLLEVQAVEQSQNLPVGDGLRGGVRRARPLKEAALEAYENTPCSICRVWAAGELEAAGALPEWISAELQFDSDGRNTPERKNVYKLSHCARFPIGRHVEPCQVPWAAPTF
jgi:hypothetical protein